MLTAFQRSLIYVPRKVSRVELAESGIDPRQIRTVRTRTADGLTLYGWHVLPEDAWAERPEDFERLLQTAEFVALYFSGNGGHRGYRGTELRLLSQAGLHVVLLDYRGYGDSEGSPSEEGLAEDARAAWRFVTQQRKVAAERVVLYGESLGGAVAVRLAAERSQEGEVPAGLILRSTFSSLVEVGAYHYRWLPVRWLLVDRYPSVERIKQVQCPILQIHARADTIVPIRFARKLFEAAPERSVNGVPKRFVELTEGDHNDLPELAGTIITQEIREFLNQLREKSSPQGNEH